MHGKYLEPVIGLSVQDYCRNMGEMEVKKHLLHM